MPGYRTHMGAGVLTYIGVMMVVSTYFVYRPSFFLALEWFFCCVVGSLFPDIDIKSKGQLIFYRVMAICLVYFLWKGKMAAFVWASLLSMVPLLVRHRGLFHKIWFVGFVAFTSALALSHWYPLSQKMLIIDACFFFAGAVSHILFDSWGTKLKFLRF